MTQKIHAGVPSEFGTFLCSREGMRDIQAAYYLNAMSELPQFDSTRGIESILEVKYGVQSAIVDHGGVPYHIATTHFTWTPDGAVPSDAQHESMRAFLAHIKTLPAHVISGDFNIPRHHNPLYGELMQHYKDAIPQTLSSSLDPTLHRLGNDPDKHHLFTDYMVDYVLVQEPYRAEDVRLEFGISDHAAVVAHIKKTT
jgi:endonuclease/exonuclease/phosphatase family metal-dependent hydrolase